MKECLKKTILIVHPFTSEKILYSTIKNRGYKIITLITPLDINWIKHCYPILEKFSDYTLHISGKISTDIAVIKQLLSKENLALTGVINAFDYSTEYADALANHFLSTDIDLEYSHARCNKFLTNAMLERAQIRCIRSILIKSENEILEKEHIIKDMNFPLIIKPTNLSAARNNVMIAYDFTSATCIINKLFATKNIFNDQAITDVIVQEYIQGEEWVVNTASYNGKHHIAGIFKYRKSKNRLLEILSLDGKEDRLFIKNLIEYNLACLNALKVNYGITHNELIVDEKGIPYLIEINNRLSGVELPMLSSKCYGTDEISMFLDLLENKKTQEFNLTSIFAHSKILGLSNFYNKDATTINLEGISSQHEVIMFRPGIVDISGDQGNDLFLKISAGLWLLNEHRDTLNKDVDLLFAREKNGSLFN